MKLKDDKKLLVIGLNPVWQVTLFFDSLKLGGVNRATGKKSFPGGKGINFSRAALVTDIPIKLFQFFGGYLGQLIDADLDKEGIPHKSIPVSLESRRCTTCLSPGRDMTELIEPANRVSEAECRLLIEDVAANISIAGGIMLCGTVPPGAENIYGEVAEMAKKNAIPLFVDSCQHIERALEAGITALKINSEELRQISGRKSLSSAIASMFARYKLDYLAVTDGPDRACLCDGKKVFNFILPRLDNIVSTLGAGDTCSAIFVCRMLAGSDPIEAFKQALSCASASCLTDRCASFDMKIAEDIANNIAVERGEDICQMDDVN